MCLNEDEYSLFMQAMAEYENAIQERVSVSKFMRDIFIPMLKEDNNPSAYDEIFKYRNGNNPTKENVSQAANDPIKEQKNNQKGPSPDETLNKNVSSKLPDSWGEF
jgi:hypothetical protein